MSDEAEDLAVSLANVLRDLHAKVGPFVRGLIEETCEEHGVEIDWDADTTSDAPN